jgi:hypothetical protein
VLGSHYSALEKEGQRNEKAGICNRQWMIKKRKENRMRRYGKKEMIPKSHCIRPLITLYFRREKVLMTHTCGIHLLAICDE